MRSQPVTLEIQTELPRVVQTIVANIAGMRCRQSRSGTYFQPSVRLFCSLLSGMQLSSVGGRIEEDQETLEM